MKGKHLLKFLPCIHLLLLVILPKGYLYAQCEQAIITDIISNTTSSATLKIIDNNNMPLLWQYEIDLAGFDPDGQEDGNVLSQEFTIDGLQSGTNYDVYIRTVCSETDTSTWNGPFQFFTIIDNNEPCFLSLPIPDNSCGESNLFPIEISGFGNNLLGQQIFISDIHLIIEHSFPEDLSLRLISPEGRSVELSSNEGLGLLNYGNPDLDDCSEPISFSDQACEVIDENTMSLTGSFRPNEMLSTFDGEQADGVWFLEVCDKNLGDVGILNHLNIQLTTITCPVPTQMYFDQIHADSVVIEWPQIVNCLNIVINYGPCGFEPGFGTTQTVNCLQEGFTITGLDPETCYDIYLSTICSISDSPFSCQFTFETACKNISYQSDFDDESVCSNLCTDQCILDGAWINIDSDDLDWLSNNTSSPTDFTGPINDFKGNGNYLYIENQSQFCPAGSQAILESSCLNFVSTGDGCDFSFAYHMFGSDISFLDVQISVDNKQSWTSLQRLVGEQSDSWQRTTISLEPYNGQAGNLRFISESGQGSFGDVAIDDFIFYGSTYDPDADRYYIDNDLDGFGDIESDTFFFCVNETPLGFSAFRSDCNDNDSTINPDANEINCNAIDENCNGLINEEGAPGMITVTDINIINATCSGALDGQISLEIEGGIAPFEFNWTGANSNSNILSGISNGLYDCVIEDVSGCQTAVSNLLVDVDSPLSYQLIDLHSVTCLDTDNGSIEIEVAGGSGNYNYLWNTGDTEKSIAGLPVGQYNCIITDQLGCVLETDTFNIIEAEIFSAFIDSIRHLECFEDQSGFLRVNTTGISPVELIQWSNGALNIDQIDNLEAGIYSVTVASSDGCESIVDSILLNEPPKLEFNFESIENVICFGGSDGSIDLNVFGGTPPYQFNWNNGEKTEDINNLTSGFYFVNIRDNNNCQVNSNAVLVSEFSPVVIELDSIKHVDCPGSVDGYIEISADGGGGDYEYFWNKELFADINTIQDAPAGIYTVTVVDRFGCKSEVTNFEIEELNEPIQLEPTILDLNACFGDETADIYIEAKDFRAPIEFTWSNGIQHLSNDGLDSILNLKAGSYQVTVTDGEGCTGVSEVINIQQPEELSFLTIIKDLSCFDSKDGEITLFVEGGTGEYTYAWSNGEDTAQITELNSGNYFCIIRDENNCLISTQNIFVDAPPRISVNLRSLAIESDSFNLSIDIENGNLPFQCEWSGEQVITQDNCKAFVRGTGVIHLNIEDQQSCVLDTSFILDLETNVVNTSTSSDQILKSNIIHQGSISLNQDIWDEIQIFSTDGQLIYRSQAINQRFIDLANLNAGVYIITASNQHRRISQRFIIFR